MCVGVRTVYCVETLQVMEESEESRRNSTRGV